MKKNILLMVLVLLLVGCETGTRYDKNTTTQTVPKDQLQSGLVDNDDIESLFNEDKQELQGKPYYYEETTTNTEIVKDKEEESNFISSGVVRNGLDVRKIREGKHKGYIRLVFDVYNDTKPANEVGYYEAKYSESKNDIAVILNGYGKFSAPLPSFPYYSVIEQIHFEQYPRDRGFKFHIQLRKNAKVKIFDLKNPARIVFDIKPI